MSSRTFRWALVGIIVAGILGSAWAIRSAFNERTKNRQACETLNTRAVYISDGRYLCITPDGRVVQP